MQNNIGTTCNYTICKNESKKLEQWLWYSKPFDFKCILDTGSTDGTWEMLQEHAAKDHTLIIEQKEITPWDFSVARNYNLSMVPDHVDWCLSADMDEYFSKNVLAAMTALIAQYPHVTNISTTRLDIYSDEVFVGPPNHLPSNKIHRRHDYNWKSRIYEHLIYNGGGQEAEIHSPNLFLIHDQDFKKEERSPLYLKMLLEAFHDDPHDMWCLWFLCNHYYREKDLPNFIMTGSVFVTNHTRFDVKYASVLNELTQIYHHHGGLTAEQKVTIENAIRGKTI